MLWPPTRLKYEARHQLSRCQIAFACAFSSFRFATRRHLIKSLSPSCTMKSLRGPTMIDQFHPYTTDYHPTGTGDYSTGTSTALQDDDSFFTESRYKKVPQILLEDSVLSSGSPDLKFTFDNKHDTVISSIEGKHGPTRSTCTWTIGWKTPCLILLPYIFGKSLNARGSQWLTRLSSIGSTRPYWLLLVVEGEGYQTYTADICHDSVHDHGQCGWLVASSLPSMCIHTIPLAIATP